MRPIDLIIIHCTATPEGRELRVSELIDWHKQRGFRTIGYHYLVTLDGSVERGRDLSRIGAHTEGKNEYSIGIAYAGGLAMDCKTPKDTRTASQKESMKKLVFSLLQQFPKAKVAGHYHFASKACPSFDVVQWCKSIGIKDTNIYKL